MKLIFIILVSINFQISHQIKKIELFIKSGNLTKSIELANSLYNEPACKNKIQLDSLKQVAMRTYIDFSKTEKQVDEQILNKIGKFSAEQKAEWENKNWLEYRIIDGRKMYFKRAVGNLQLRLKQQADSINNLKTTDDFDRFKALEAEKNISETQSSGILTSAKKFKISYTVTLQANAVPEGETIRCWLPWPKENHARQTNIVYLNSFPSNMYFAPTSIGQRSAYSEQKTVKDKETKFNIEFSMSTYAQYFNPQNIVAKPYNTESEIFRKYTKEQKPHIVFTENIKKLAEEITGNETNPLKNIQSFYNYICNNIIWSGALEYSIFDQIPEYVLANRKGDCGMQTMLIMSLARYKGIPVRWQSGFMLHPNKVNLHDWCEVYYEGTGWVPLDMSFQKMHSSNEEVKNFYQTGIDAYRLIINDELSTLFIPAKKYMRSEPFDFQRGELEWEGGNIYFDKWDYSIEVEYNK